LLVDGHQHTELDQGLLEELYLRSQVLHLLAERHCRLTRLDVSQLQSWIEGPRIGTLKSIEHIRWQLEQKQEKLRWGSLLLDGHDHWDFIKQLKTNMVLLVADQASLPATLCNEIKAASGVGIHQRLFDVIAKGDQTLDWHYYLADVAAFNKQIHGKDLLILSIGAEQVARLDTLKWKKNLTVVYLKWDGQTSKSESKFTLSGGLESFMGGEDNRVQSKLHTVLADRHCSYYEVSIQNKDFLLDIIKTLPEKFKKRVMKEG